VSIQSFLSNPSNLRIALFVLVGAALLAAYLWHRRGRRPLRAGMNPTDSELSYEPGSVSFDRTNIFLDRPSFGERILRGGLVLLALIVAIGFVLVLLPGGTMQSMVGALQASKAADLPADKIALLYLGDETKGKDFQVRGIVRNISNETVENLDATVRLYSPENILLETVVVRMDHDSILPDAIADFRLVYPNYAGQFGSYSVDFKLRQGEAVFYKDRRGTRHLE